MSDPSSKSNGDAAGWEEAVSLHRRWLRTVIYSRLANVHATEEVLQNVAVCAIEQHPVLDDPANVRAWLYRVAVRQSLLYRRRLGREKRRALLHTRNQDTQVTTAEHYDPLRWLLADEERELVRTAIRKLKPRDSEILLLKYTENWSCRELADHLGIQVTTVETRLHRARQRLRSELARLDITEESR